MADLDSALRTRGWAFPFQFSTSTGGVGTVESTSEDTEIEIYRSSIFQILGTALQSRAMRRDFGSRINTQLFQPIDERLASILIDNVIAAIQKWEPDVDLGPVELGGVTEEPARVDIGIQFRVRRSRRVGQIIFPFFPLVERS